MAISRIQQPQQIQGGLGSLQDPRQNYGLGKLVKKAFRGIKKIAKSPLGKAALLYAGTAGLGALGGGGFKGLSWLKPSMVMKNWGNAGILGKLKSGKGILGGFGNIFRQGGDPTKSFSVGRMLAGGLGATALAAPFMMGGDEEEEEEESWTNVPSSIADIRNQAKNYYTLGSAGSNLNFMPQKQFVDANYYAADGGRVGLLNGGEAGQEQIEQMLMAEYVKYKNQGGTLTFEQFVQAIMQQQQEQQGGGMEQPQEVAMAADGGRIGYEEGTPEPKFIGVKKAFKERPPENILMEIKQSYSELISSKKNFGKGNAIKLGIEKSKGEIVIIQDADLEYYPKDYKRLLEPFKKKEINVVYGSRVLNKNR